MQKIYKTYLIKRGACKDQVKLFAKLYPDGIHACRECLKDAQNQGLDVWWLPRLLDWPFWDRYQFCEQHTKLCQKKGMLYSLVRRVDKKGLAILEKALLEAPRPK